jgi:hypothetical protein
MTLGLRSRHNCDDRSLSQMYALRLRAQLCHAGSLAFHSSATTVRNCSNSVLPVSYPLYREPGVRNKSYACLVGSRNMSTPHERRFRRFNLSYQVHVRFPSGDSVAEVDAVSRNISICGLLLESTLPIPCRSQLEFTIILGDPIPRLIKLGGRGEVVRLEAGATTNTFGIAVACAEPIHQIENYLPDASGL